MRILICCLCLLATVMAVADEPAIDPSKVDADYALQGEYVGTIKSDEGEIKIGVQVIALGDGKFRAVGYHGGLPGDGWDGEETHETEGQRDGDKVTFKTDEGTTAELKDGSITAYAEDGTRLIELQRVQRSSPTLGQKPPEGAVVLFNGLDADQWKDGKMTDRGLLMQGTTSLPTFGSHRLHIEFLLPYQPHERGQKRGNSGIYLQGRYEVQMLDSFGLEGKHNECGGLYSVKDPDVNMCLPPLTWQTYDIDFTAATYGEDGQLATHPKVTVRHNGVVIHRDVELPGDRSTTAAPLKPGSEKGPIFLQNHGNPVRYRNIWVLER